MADSMIFEIFGGEVDSKGGSLKGRGMLGAILVIIM